MTRYTIILTGDSDDFANVQLLQKVMLDIAPYILDNVYITAPCEGDAHSFGSEIGGLAAEAQQLLGTFEPYIMTDSLRQRFNRLDTIINEIDSRASIWED